MIRLNYTWKFINLPFNKEESSGGDTDWINNDKPKLSYLIFNFKGMCCKYEMQF